MENFKNISKSELNKPKEEIKDVVLRFEDYIGNALNSVSFAIGILEYKKDATVEARIDKAWKDLFRRLEIFLESGFEPTANVTRENIEKMLEFRNRNFEEPGVYEELYKIFDLMRS